MLVLEAVFTLVQTEDSTQDLVVGCTQAQEVVFIVVPAVVCIQGPVMNHIGATSRLGLSSSSILRNSG